MLIESLLYSRPGMMELLPAKPMGSFDRGSLKGVSARTFCRVDAFEWNLPAHTMRLTLTSLKDAKKLAITTVDEAVEALDSFGDEADFLRDLATYLIARNK